MRSSISSRPYFSNLDATRFIAFIPVFLTHCFYTTNTFLKQDNWFINITKWLDIGLLGLDYFFVLSAFLITTLMINEYENKSTISFYNFYIRRSLRIFPLYFLMVAIGFAAHGLNINHTVLPSVFYFITFALNFYIVNHGYDFLFFLVFLWSISVEEQFYVVWGLLLKLFSHKNINLFKNAILIGSIVLIVVSIVFRILYFHNNLSLYFNTISVAGNFGIGCLLAYCCVYNNSFIILINNLSKNKITLIYSILILLIIFYQNLFKLPIMIVFERIIFSAFFAFIIAEQSFSRQKIFNFGKYNFTNYLGKISLGLYCYHGIVITVFIYIAKRVNIANKTYQVLFLNPLLMLIATILLAIISYECFEKHILALKKRFYS